MLWKETASGSIMEKMRAGETMKPSEPQAHEDAAPASKVLSDDDLLGVILQRVDSPTTLVRAALVAKRWLRRASDPAFLRGFLERHPPRLLGFHVTGDCVMHPEFVQMPKNTEFAAALRRAGSVFDAFRKCSPRFWDSRNGRVLFDFISKADYDYDDYETRRSLAVIDALRRPRGAMTVLPPPPPPSKYVHAVLLPDDDGDAATCYRVGVMHLGRSVSAEVHVLRSGAWTVLCSARDELAVAPQGLTMTTLLAGGKVYMVALAGFIIAVDLATASLFAIDLPEGVPHEYCDNLVPCRGDDDSVLYLLHAKGDTLRLWLRRMDDNDNAGGGEWVLRDTVSLKETCGDLIIKQGFEEADGDMFSSANVVGVGDNAEFVFLELGVGDSLFVVHLHLGTRRAQKVYKRHPDNDENIQVHPFSMVWPPVFPDRGEESCHA